MKYLLLIFAFAIVSFSAFAQNSKIDKRLLVKYTTEELNNLQIDNPDDFHFLTYCITSAFIVGDLSQEKFNANPNAYKEISIENLPVINFYSLKVDLLENESQYFIIKGTKKLLMVKSKKQINNELNR